MAVVFFLLGGSLWAQGRVTPDTNGVSAAGVGGIKNLRWPVEYYPDGKLKTQLIAGLAKIPAQGDIEATEVRLECYAEDGSLDTVVTAESCSFNRTNSTAHSDGAVFVERKDSTLKGKGFEWNGQDQLVKILKDVEVVLKGDLNLKEEGKEP